MKPMLPKIRCTLAQKKALIDYMWDHRRLARYEYDPYTADTEWFRLAETLNQYGSVKSVEKWKVTWRDLKRKALKEVQTAVNNNTHASESAMKIRQIMMSETDGNPNEHRNLKMSPSPRASIDLTPEDSYQEVETGEQGLSQYMEPEDRSATGQESIECTLDFSSDSSPSSSPLPRTSTKLRSNQDQINTLVDCMAINTGMAFGIQQTPKKIADWKRLRQLLNRMGPAKRTAAWQHSWRDLKRHALERNNTITKNTSATTQKIIKIIEAHAQGKNSLNDVSADDGLHLRLPPQVNCLLQAKTDRPEASLNQVSPVQPAVNLVPSLQYRQRLKRITRSTNTQLCALVDYMEKHPVLAVAKFTAEEPYITEWRKLSHYLNRIGISKRSTMAWKRTWRDLKKAAKKEPTHERNFNLNERILQIFEKVADTQPDYDADFDTADLDALLFAADLDPMSPGQLSGRSSPVQRENGQSDQDEPSKTMFKKSLRRCTNGQKHALVDYMSTHRALAKSKFTAAIEGEPHYAEWRQLSKYLNKIGTAKTTLSWKRTWRDLKKSVRRKKRSGEKLLGLDLKILKICEKDPIELNTETEQVLDLLPDPTDGMPILYIKSPKHTKSDIILCDPSHEDPANEDSVKHPRQSQEPADHLGMSPGERSREVSPDQRSRESPAQSSHGSPVRHQNRSKRYSALKENRRVRCTPAQINALVAYMGRHPSLARARCQYMNSEPDPHYQEWRRLCRYLNNADTTAASKSVSKWKCTWRTLVINARRKDYKRSRWYDRVSTKILQILNENEPEHNEKNVEEHVTQSNEDSVYPPSPDQSVTPDPLKCEPTEDIELNRDENSELPKRCTSNLQIRALTDFMISHPELATKHLTEQIPAWVKITRHLNSIGPARSMKEWSQTWKDLKIRARSKANAKDPSSSLQGNRERKLRQLLGMSPRGPAERVRLPSETDDEAVEEYKLESEVVPRAPSPRTVIYNLAEILARNNSMNDNNRETNNKKSTPDTSVTDETNDILRELVLELKRSNELKTDQNCYLKDILQQLKAPTCAHACQHTSTPTPIDVSQPDRIETLDIPKEEDTPNEDDQDISEVPCIGAANDEVPAECAPVIRPVALASLTSIDTPGEQYKRVKVQSIVKAEPKHMTRRIIRLKDGRVFLMPNNMKTPTKPNQDKNCDQLYVVCGRKRK